MKSIIVLLTSTIIFASVGLGSVTQSSVSADILSPDFEVAYDIDEIAGYWHDFPNGLSIRFNRDGTVSFGLDANGKTIGYEGNFGFRGEQLLIDFIDYDGQDEACANGVGVYQVNSLDNGGLAFVPLRDRCQVRVNALSGNGVESGPIFHPVN
jgi:hypothetical protein